MPADMPPSMPVSYAVEHVMANAADQTASRLIAAAIGTRALIAARSASSAPMSQRLPAIDPTSPSLAASDRAGLSNAGRAQAAGGLARAVARPGSYVADRISLAVAYAKAGRDMEAGTLDSSTASALQCRMVAITLDPRAGAYVAGGEQAASAARRAVPAAAIAKCREAVSEQRSRTTSRVAFRPALVAAGRDRAY